MLSSGTTSVPYTALQQSADWRASPTSPADGNRHLVASGATGLWAGWDLNIAFWVDGAWIRLVPRTGWLLWVAAEGLFVVWTGAVWEVVGEPRDVPDAVFSLVNDAEFHAAEHFTRTRDPRGPPDLLRQHDLLGDIDSIRNRYGLGSQRHLRHCDDDRHLRHGHRRHDHGRDQDR
jgi:hypothetical protein